MAAQSGDLVTQRIHAHAAAQFQAYRGNSAFVFHVVKNDWLPAEDEPGIEQHLAAPRQHLVDAGRPEHDEFLPRFGLVVPGVRRGIVRPVMVLAANRGGFAARRLREAEGQVRRLREALAIGRRFYSDLSGDTRQAVLDLAELCERPSVPDEAVWLNMFGELSPDAADQLAERAIISRVGRSPPGVGGQITRST